MAILLVVGVGGYLAYRSYKPAAQTTPEVTTPTTTEASPAETMAPEATPEAKMDSRMVNVTAGGFAPKSITIKAGETVTWTNKDTKTHNISSVPHPTHTTYPPLNLGNFMAEKTVTLTFPTKGTYMYHNHLFPTLFGSVIVE